MPSPKIVAIVLGTRPEIIKMMPVMRAVEGTESLQTIIISTGQQKEMAAQAFANFGVVPARDLGLMTPNQTLADLTARLVSGVASTLGEIKPDAVLVHGDTTTALATTLAASYLHLPIGHVEAGLRTYNFEAPWPEEMNRRLIDPLCRWCFAPTSLNRSNLLAERIQESNIFVTGNTVIDSLIATHERLEKLGLTAFQVGRKHNIPESFCNKFLQSASKNRMLLVTGHRRESFGMAFEQLCHGILKLVESEPDLGVVYPVHLNPNVQGPVKRLLGSHPRIQLIDPVGYEDFVILMARAYFILTDSGGIQEEAPSLGKPVLVMRDTTERPEGVAAGTCQLVGTNADRIFSESKSLLNDPIEYSRRAGLHNPYGDGKASQRIAQILATTL